MPVVRRNSEAQILVLRRPASETDRSPTLVAVPQSSATADRDSDAERRSRWLVSRSERAVTAAPSTSSSSKSTLKILSAMAESPSLANAIPPPLPPKDEVPEPALEHHQPSGLLSDSDSDSDSDSSSASDAMAVASAAVEVVVVTPADGESGINHPRTLSLGAQPSPRSSASTSPPPLTTTTTTTTSPPHDDPERALPPLPPDATSSPTSPPARRQPPKNMLPPTAAPAPAARSDLMASADATLDSAGGENESESAVCSPSAKRRHRRSLSHSILQSITMEFPVADSQPRAASPDTTRSPRSSAGTVAASVSASAVAVKRTPEIPKRLPQAHAQVHSPHRRVQAVVDTAAPRDRSSTQQLVKMGTATVPPASVAQVPASARPPSARASASSQLPGRASTATLVPPSSTASTPGVLSFYQQQQQLLQYQFMQQQQQLQQLQLQQQQLQQKQLHIQHSIAVAAGMLPPATAPQVIVAPAYYPNYLSGSAPTFTSAPRMGYGGLPAAPGGGSGTSAAVSGYYWPTLSSSPLRSSALRFE